MRLGAVRREPGEGPDSPEAPGEGRRGTRRRWTTLAVATLAALLTAEIGLRVAAHLRNLGLLSVALTRDYPVPKDGRVSLANVIRLTENDRIVYELKPHLDAVQFKGRSLTTNSHGFRGPELEPGRPPGTVTIVAIGDSVLFGHGVADGEPFARLLEARLNEEYPAVRWRVVNTGVPGYNTAMEVETLRTKGLAFEPDVVLWSVVPNDLELPPYLRSEEAVLDPGRSFLVEWVRKRLGAGPELEVHPLLGRAPGISAEEQRQRAAGVETFEIGLDVPERYRDLVGWAPFERAADELVALAEERGFRLFAFANYVDDTVEGMLAEAEERGVPTFTLTDELMAHMDAIGNHHFKYTDLVVGPENRHPSALQHRMSCEKLMEALESLGWLEELATAGARAEAEPGGGSPAPLDPPASGG